MYIYIDVCKHVYTPARAIQTPKRQRFDCSLCTYRKQFTVAVGDGKRDATSSRACLVLMVGDAQAAALEKKPTVAVGDGISDATSFRACLVLIVGDAHVAALEKKPTVAVGDGIRSRTSRCIYIYMCTYLQV